jgi:hypothetical protein
MGNSRVHHQIDNDDILIVIITSDHFGYCLQCSTLLHLTFDKLFTITLFNDINLIVPVECSVCPQCSHVSMFLYKELECREQLE